MHVWQGTHGHRRRAWPDCGLPWLRPGRGRPAPGSGHPAVAGGASGRRGGGFAAQGAWRPAAAEPLGEGFREGAPDLAVEVLSPDQSPREGHEKALAWLDAGAALVWVVNPAARTVSVYRSRTDTETFSVAAELDGGTLLPGFRCPVAGLFGNQ
ncbi:MAG: Uma2 family endonuclease [Planctomycetes bacterium]|nr:Uma2 family endonuclease [Planctomycetota bacterium]